MLAMLIGCGLTPANFLRCKCNPSSCAKSTGLSVGSRSCDAPSMAGWESNPPISGHQNQGLGADRPPLGDKQEPIPNKDQTTPFETRRLQQPPPL